MFLNVWDIEAMYESAENSSSQAVLRLHERDSLQVRETYSEIEALIEQAIGA
jgi:hypothetical protein